MTTLSPATAQPTRPAAGGRRLLSRLGGPHLAVQGLLALLACAFAALPLLGQAGALELSCLAGVSSMAAAAWWRAARWSGSRDRAEAPGSRGAGRPRRRPRCAQAR